MNNNPSNEKPNIGSVTLVGAGPGRGTITLRGLEAIRLAQVICYDELLDKELLNYAAADCELIPVGKRHGAHSMPQPEITALLIEKARQGKRVVRLKGGDSFVFGRGSEEAGALKDAGIPFELVPGVSSATAVPEALGIPVTHRSIAPSFTVVTGHGADGASVDYETLSRMKGTLLFLMGMHNMAEITDKLIAHGMDPDTPAAVLSKGLMPGEQRIDGTLGTIAELAKAAPAPGIILIGGVAEFHLEKTFSRPLDGACIIAAGTAPFTERLKNALDEQGAYVIRKNCLKTEVMPENFPEDLSRFDWIVFTSGNGATGFFEGLRSCGMDVRGIADKKYACVGKGTADKLYEYGIRADFVPSQHSAKCLGRELSELLTGSGNHGAIPMQRAGSQAQRADSKLLLVLAENASPDLATELDTKGISYEICTIYRTAPDIAASRNPESHAADYVVFSSQTSVRAFFGAPPAESQSEVSPGSQNKEPSGPGIMPRGAKAVCMGSAAARELARYFKGTVLMAEKAGIPGVVSTITSDYKRTVSE